MKFTEEQLEELKKSTPFIMNNMMEKQANLDISENIKCIQTPEERLEFLTKRIDNIQSELITQTESLRKSEYENMKLNAQIEVMNKTIDSNNEELHKLRSANFTLKTINKTLEENNQVLKNNNKHYWIRNILVTLIGVIVGWLLGKYFA